MLLNAGCALPRERNASNEIAAAALQYRFREAPYQETIRMRLDGEGVDVADVISRTGLAERRVIFVAREDAKGWEGGLHEDRADKSVGLLHLFIKKISKNAAEVILNCEWESATVTYTQKLRKGARGWEVIRENLDDIK